MRSLARLLPLPVVLLAFAVTSPARAHVGAVVAKAVFLQPAPPAERPGPDGGMVWSYTPAEADSHYLLSWQDGDTDPTGRFTFYYMPYLAPVNASLGEIDGSAGGQPLGKIVVGTGGREARDVWTSCGCGVEDAGGPIADGAACTDWDGGARRCDNQVDWDTSNVADGVYWIYVANNDPPYHVYNTSEAPIRVSHGAHKPPVVLVIRPDGVGLPSDRSYRAAVIVRGEGALTLDLAWGVNEADRWRNPLVGFASNLPAVTGADGLVWFDWDVSMLPPEVYFVSALVTDGNSLKSFSDSRYGLSVFHRPDLLGAGPIDMGGPSGPADLSASEDALHIPPIESSKGCGCALGAARAPRRESTAALLCALAIAISLRARRAGSRSGCTGSRT